MRFANVSTMGGPPQIRSIYLSIIALSTFVVAPSAITAQDSPRPKLFDGSAVVRVNDGEYKILILCEDASSPELGFLTEPNRVTRANTGGRYNMVNLRLRDWKDTSDVVVTLNRNVAWLPKPTSVGGKLSLKFDMSPASVLRDNMPVALTYDMWNSGDRPPGYGGVEIEAQCGARDPEAPSYRKVTPE